MTIIVICKPSIREATHKKNWWTKYAPLRSRGRGTQTLVVRPLKNTFLRLSSLIICEITFLKIIFQSEIFGPPLRVKVNSVTTTVKGKLYQINIYIQPVSYKRYFRCNNCLLLLVYTINLSLSLCTDLVDPPPMGTFYMKHKVL